MDLILETCNHFRTKLLEINRAIRALSKTADYKENSKLLLTVPGVGIITAMQILTEIEDIHRFNNFKHLCSYIGLIPSTDTSGDNVKASDITPRAHHFLRRMIIESA